MSTKPDEDERSKEAMYYTLANGVSKRESADRDGQRKKIVNLKQKMEMGQKQYS